MKGRKSVDNHIEAHVMDKRNELVWALKLQNYTFAEIGRIFNMHRSTVLRICKERPKDWKPKWKKEVDN